jgi:hypothetical protein
MAVVLVAGWMGGSWMLAVGLDNSCGNGAATGWMQKNQEGSWLREVKIVVRSKLWHQMDETELDARSNLRKWLASLNGCGKAGYKSILPQ